MGEIIEKDKRIVEDAVVVLEHFIRSKESFGYVYEGRYDYPIVKPRTVKTENKKMVKFLNNALDAIKPSLEKQVYYVDDLKFYVGDDRAHDIKGKPRDSDIDFYIDELDVKEMRSIFKKVQQNIIDNNISTEIDSAEATSLKKRIHTLHTIGV